MYSRRGVGPRMDPGGSAALVGYSGEDLPFKTA